MSFSQSKIIPITAVKTGLNDAIRMAVREISQFLSLFYPEAFVTQQDAAEKVAGQWLSRIKSFHKDDDFLFLVQDYLQVVLSGGERSKTSDTLAYYFSGFMPTYGSTRILIDMVYDGRPWSEIQAFMHTVGYGDARKYIEEFDYKGAQDKIKTECKSWQDILKQQDGELHLAQNSPPTQLAFAPSRGYSPTITDIPTEPIAEPKAAPATSPLASIIRVAAIPWLAGLIIFTIPSNAYEGDSEQHELDRMARREEKRKRLAEEKKKLVILEVEQINTATTNATNNTCTAQTEENKKNGAECENDGYILMEETLLYRRLMNPPKGKGLDGLFEKPELKKHDPTPFPDLVKIPKPGKVIFIPAESKPPNIKYAWDSKFPSAAYPRFVVFEAKHIAKRFDASDTEGITKEAKNRMGRTCDGAQMSTKWTNNRIKPALKKQNGTTQDEKIDKLNQIKSKGYARWIFICLPGPLDDSQTSKLYILIDVVAASMDLENIPAKTRKQTQDNKGY